MPRSTANNCNYAQGDEKHSDTVTEIVFCYIILPERPSYVQIWQQVIILYVLKTNVFLARIIVFSEGVLVFLCYIGLCLSLEKKMHIYLKYCGDPLIFIFVLILSGMDYKSQCFAYLSQSCRGFFWRSLGHEERKRGTARANRNPG